MRHKVIVIPLDKSHWEDEHSEFKTWCQAPKPREVVKWLRKYIKKDLASLKHCPNCGGIIPELMFTFEGKEYYFTCYEIRENNKVTVKTDYEKFASFCSR